MAEFEKKHHGSSEFNRGNKYVANDGVQPATINNAVENSLYDYAFLQALTETPDVSEANSTGTPSVTLIDNPGTTQGISGAKKFKFSHLKGATGATPNFSIGTITSGTSATDASVTITGTPENPILNFTLPRGRSISSITAGTPSSTDTQTTTPITVSYDDGTSSSFSVVSARGLKGDPVWVRYATDSAGSGMTATPSSSTKYIGFYVGSAASTTASDYRWSKYAGKEPSSISIGVSDDAAPSPEVTVEWDDGSSPTVVPIDTSACLATESVDGMVTSVNGKDGAVTTADEYDAIIRTQEEFNALIASSDWLGYKSVIFAGSFSASSPIVVPSTVRRIAGRNDATIDFINVTSSDALFGYSDQISDYVSYRYEIKNIIFNVQNCTCPAVVYNMRNVYNCAIQITATNRDESGFVSCKHLKSCSALSTSVRKSSPGGGSMYFYCEDIYDCLGGMIFEETPSIGGTGVFSNCKRVYSCYSSVRVPSSTQTFANYVYCKFMFAPQGDYFNGETFVRDVPYLSSCQYISSARIRSAGVNTFIGSSVEEVSD